MQVVPQELYDSMGSIMPEAVTLVLTVGDFATSETNSATLSAAVGGGPVFSIGNACPARFETKFDYSGDDLTGKAITVGWKTDDSDTYPLFSGTVATAETVGGVTSITAYDALFSSTVYRPSSTVLRSCTAAQALEDIARALGVVLDAATKTAAQKIALTEGLEPLSEVTPAQAAGTVAALMGGNAIVNRAGELAVKTWADTGWTAEVMSGAGIAQTAPFAVSGLTFVRKKVDTSGPIETDTLETFSAGNGGISQENALATAVLTNGAFNAIKSIPAFSAGTYTLAGGLLLEPCDSFGVLTASGTYRVFAAQVVTMLSGGCNTGVSCWGASADGRPASPTAQALKKISADLAEFQKLTADYAKITTADVDNLKIGTATLKGAVDGLELSVGGLEDDMDERFAALDVTLGGIRSTVSAAQTTADNAQKAADEYKAGSEKALADYASTVQKSIGDLQSQVDGQIETWYFDYEPTLLNRPATDWTTDALRTLHEGDLFYWSSKGYAYRFMKEGTLWKWVLIQDTGITQAMASAAAAQTTANNKRRVFTAQPVPPYDAGDLWTNGTDLLTCVQARASGTLYTVSDWAKQVGYTDDTAANAAQAGVERVTERVATVEQTAEGLKTRVTATETVANSAKNAVDNLSVGGRNLFLSSGDLGNRSIVAYGAGGTYRYKSIVGMIDESVPSKNCVGIECSVSGAGGPYFSGNIVGKNYYGKIKAGDKFVFSVWAKCSADKTVGRMKVEFGGPDVIYNLPPLSTEWQKYTAVGTAAKNVDATSSGAVAITFYYGTELNVGDILYLSSPKLEKGNIATDWTPAPEDTADRISKAESSIEQTAEQITQKVSKTDYTGEKVASMINLTPDTVQISGKKVNIAGNVLFQATQKTANSAKDAIDNLEVGGRNLLPGTNETPIECEYPETGFKDYLKWVTTQKLSGDKYTLSFWAKSTVAGDKMLTYFYDPSNISAISGSQGQNGTSGDGKCVFTLSAIWEKYWVIYTIPKNENSTRRVIVGRLGLQVGASGSGIVSIKASKLEKGTIATDWTPAPEDVESQISTALDTARSKSAAYRQATAPTGTAVQNGDVWFDTQGGGIYNRVNGQWVAHQTGTVSIADGAVTADKITVDQLFANAVLSQDIQAEKLNVGVDYGPSKNTYSLTTSDTGYISISSGVNGLPISSYFHLGPRAITMSSTSIEMSGQWDGGLARPCTFGIGGAYPTIKPYGHSHSYDIPLIQHGIAELNLPRNTNLDYGFGMQVAFPTAFPDGTKPTVVFSPAGYLPEVCRLTMSQISATGFFVGAEYLSETSLTIPIHWMAFG